MPSDHDHHPAVFSNFYITSGPGSSVGIATGWTVRGSYPGGGEIFRTFPDRFWGPPSVPYNGYQIFPGGKERPGRDADPSSLLVPWSRKSRAIPLLPVLAVRPVQSLTACTRVHFTFFFTLQCNHNGMLNCCIGGHWYTLA